jgi:hypothetical protein
MIPPVRILGVIYDALVWVLARLSLPAVSALEEPKGKTLDVCP